MQDFAGAFGAAWHLLTTLDPALMEIVGLSLGVTGAAVAIACIIGLPLGAALAVTRFPGRPVLVTTVNALMGLPPVVVGLTVYMMLSAAGPLGPLDLLYTPAAMVIAQAILVTPIVTALARQVIEDLNGEYRETLASMRATRAQVIGTLLWDGRHALVTAALAGLGRALAEVGAVMIVGGNIAHVTRVMTTAIALETSRGELALALGLGAVLLLISFTVNAAVMALRVDAARYAHA
ncbi:MAG: ABC transporter permease [Pseudomonadota bacterium]